MIWLAPAASFFACWLALVWLLRRDRLPMDHPNDRSLHQTPTPRVGGLGIMAGMAVAALWLSDAAVLTLMLSALALAAVSVFDDVRGLPVGLCSWVRSPQYG
jgi:UDP-N-acetylmuramyl pentapeptide phosphotransferase/UDP-N-acetylglucosamine-1-phosphate transferase